MSELEKTLFDHIVFIYGKEKAEPIFQRIINRLNQFKTQYPDLAKSSPQKRVSERDTILITYGDMVQSDGEKPLKTLSEFLKKYIGGAISIVHILPFFPYSSDDGFSVIDYYQVNPDFGDWTDITGLGKYYRLMMDAVVNHISTQSSWFQGFLNGDQKFENYFTVIEKDTDLSQVFRPRASPILTSFDTSSGRKHVWTTFSKDQVDLNYANPDVLIEVIDILLFFAAHGAEFIRLDAVTYVWKEIGTSCINSAHTHRIVQTIRTIFDIVAPKIALITETNVPHKDNIAYFGDGKNEAQMVYNFALPALTLHSFQVGDAETLSTWASTLNLPSDQATFFNFLACHDGIGLMPIKNILNKIEINNIIDRTQKLGGFVSYKNNEDGSQSPYELNINYLDALGNPELNGTDIAIIARRFIASQSIMLALRGVPGIYFHSLFGSQNWMEGVQKTNRYRTINREKILLEKIERELADTNSLRYKVFTMFMQMLKFRTSHPAFHPWGGQKILFLDRHLFATLRSSMDGIEHILCLTNVTDRSVDLRIDMQSLPFAFSKSVIDLLSGDIYALSQEPLKLTVAPYQVIWFISQ
jgi:sucrose phosphorylase